MSKRTQIYLPEELYYRLKEKSQHTGKPMAEFIRESLEKYLEEDKKNELYPNDSIWQITGKEKSGDGDLSTTHNRYLYPPEKGKMRTTVKIDEDLLKEAREVAGGASIKEVINLSLRNFVRREKMHRLAEKLGTYDLDLDQDTLEKLRDNNG
jgi:Arc/MetJ family transcription regulator